MNEEWVDILDNDGNYTGKSCSKSEAHKKGYFHPTVHVWFYTRERELLFQLRSSNKINYPNLWDVSVAGHIESSETPIQAAIRESFEELGIVLKKTDLTEIFIHKSEVIHQSNYIDNEFNHVFIAVLQIPIDKLKLQKEEVSQVKLLHFSDIEEKLKNDSIKFVPYSKEYFNTLITELRKVTS